MENKQQVRCNKFHIITRWIEGEAIPVILWLQLIQSAPFDIISLQVIHLIRTFSMNWITGTWIVIVTTTLVTIITAL